MRLLVPQASVTFLSFYGIARRFPALADLERHLGAFDLVFAGRFAAPFRDGGTFETFRAGRDVVEIPIIVFPAFHPDLVYVLDAADPMRTRAVQSGTGDYHSALAVFAYLEALPPEAVRRLLSPAVFQALGYFDLWAESAAALVETGRQAGHDLSADLVRWTRRGAFMHSTNHPKMHVAADLARGLLVRAGLVPLEADLDAYLPDEFIRQGTWPVYPALAELYGVPGSEVFLTQGIRTRAAPRTMSLEAFVAASFASYERSGPASLLCPRVAAWRADPAIWRLLRDAAGA